MKRLLSRLTKTPIREPGRQNRLDILGLDRLDDVAAKYAHYKRVLSGPPTPREILHVLFLHIRGEDATELGDAKEAGFVADGGLAVVGFGEGAVAAGEEEVGGEAVEEEEGDGEDGQLGGGDVHPHVEGVVGGVGGGGKRRRKKRKQRRVK